MAVPQHTTTNALPALNNLNIDQFIQPNYNRFEAFVRALKVFQRSFLHHNAFNVVMYQQMAQEFISAMIDLYDVADDEQLANLDTSVIANDVMAEATIMRAGVTELKPRERLKSCRVLIRCGHIQAGFNQTTWNLNVSKKSQLNCRVRINFNYSDLEYAVRNDRQIVLIYSDSIDGINQRQFPPFNIHYTQMHPEGFHQWLKFGTTYILFSIEYESQETSYDQSVVTSFHLNTILFALQRRLTHIQSLPADQQYHRHRPSTDRSVSYTIDVVNPTTRNAFWGTAHDRTQNDYIAGRVKYTDLQIGLQFGEELVSKSTRYCTCNEFCNLNAFFYYNPIYRFLLVQHNRHYAAKNRTIVANLYQLALSHCLSTPTVPMPLTPVFNLLNSASERLTENHLILYKRPQLKTQWSNSTPNGIDLEGIAYMVLIKVNLTNAMFATYARVPFDENGFTNIEKCTQILYSLNGRIGRYDQFVGKHPLTRKQWANEFDRTALNPYFSYIVKSFKEALTDKNAIFEDRLFTKDFEVTALATTSAEIAQVDRWKQIESTNNPINLTFEIKPFTYSINQIWMALTRFEPMSAISGGTALRKQCDFFKEIHDIIYSRLKAPKDFHLVRLKDSAIPPLFSQEIPNAMPAFRQFYKLKLYSRIYKIQIRFSDAVFKRCRAWRTTDMHGFKVFEAIWNNDWIESIAPSTHPLPNLFQKNTNFVTLMTEFYGQFWPKASHDRPGPKPSLNDIRDSVFQEYGKRRFWDRIDGNNRQRFRSIITSFETSLDDLVNQSGAIYQNTIMTAMEDMRNYYFIRDIHLKEYDKKYCLVLDEVIYWMIRALLYMITGIVAALLKSIDKLHSKRLTKISAQYFTSKPGLVPLFQTIDIVFKKLDTMLTNYVAFSNPFDSITDVISQTRYDIKVMYSHYMNKLIDDWLTEFDKFFTSPSPAFSSMLKLHIISGSSLLISYVDYNRRQVSRVRKRLDRMRQRGSLSDIVTRQTYKRALDLSLLWFENIKRNELAQPFTAPHWQAYLGTEFVTMDALNFTQLQARAGQLVPPPPLAP